MVAKTQNTEKEEKKRLSQKESNLIRCYSIRIENATTILYYQGDTAKEEPQQVVKQDLFNLLISFRIGRSIQNRALDLISFMIGSPIQNRVKFKIGRNIYNT